LCCFYATPWVNKLITCMYQDAFHYKIISSLLAQIPAEIQYDVLYVSNGINNIKQLKIQSPNFIMVNFDILELDEFDHTVQTITPVSQKFLQIVDTHPDTKFILMCQVGNAQKELTHARIDIVRSSSGLCREDATYKALLPELKRILTAKKHLCVSIEIPDNIVSIWLVICWH